MVELTIWSDVCTAKIPRRTGPSNRRMDLELLSGWRGIGGRSGSGRVPPRRPSSATYLVYLYQIAT